MVLMTYFFGKSFELYLISSFLLRFRPYFHCYRFFLFSRALVARLSHPNKMFVYPSPRLL